MFVREATGFTRNISGFDALIANLASMGLTAPIYIMYFASLLYPGVDLPLTVIIAVGSGLVLASIYFLLTMAMPRSGGDYVWVSRIIHPSLGLITNLFITFGFLSFIAPLIGTIPVYGIGPMFTALGQVWGNARLLEEASVISTGQTGFEISLIVLIAVMVLAFRGTKMLFRTLWVTMTVAAASAIVMTLAFLSAPHTTFISNFNRLSGMNYQDITKQIGPSSGFNLQSTLYGSVFTILNFAGYNNSAYYTGEVKQVQRSQFLAMFGAVLVFALFLAIQYSSVYYSVGSSFYSALSYLAGTGNASYTLPVAPVLTMLVAYAVPNTFVISFITVGFIMTQVAGSLIIVFVVERNFFAWSFDRLLPNAFTSLDSRGNPYFATTAILLMNTLFTVLYWYTALFEFFLYISLLFSIAYAITSLAAIAFPYTRKDIFESSPKFVTRSIRGVPLLTILGVVGLVVEGFISYATLLPAVTPPPSGPPIITLVSYLIVPLVVIVGLTMYLAAYLYWRSKGLDLRVLFRHVPPE